MSQRNLRKLLGGTTLPPPNESSDEEYEPLYVKNNQKSTYEGLVVSSSSEPENEPAHSLPKNSESEQKKVKPKNTKKRQKKKKLKSKNEAKNDLVVSSSSEPENEPAHSLPKNSESEQKKVKPKNTKKRQKKKKLKSKNDAKNDLVVSSSSEPENEPAHSLPKNSESEQKKVKPKNTKKRQKKKKLKSKNEAKNDLDEIDKSILEVNAMLGEPSPAVVDFQEPKPDALQTIFSTEYKHLNVTYELNRIFGRDTGEESMRRRGRQPNLKRIHKNTLIRKHFRFEKGGLSMSVNRRENDLQFFKFDHSRRYQRNHIDFIMKPMEINLVLEVEVSLTNGHVEALLEYIDIMFREDDYTGANNVLEQIIAYMQFVAHPSFNITNMRTRLEYKFMENRPFHIALLKYLHLLTNRACHRTALEIAKLLLNLDPTDPLAVVFIIDTVALRAREHRWLIDAIDYLDKERKAGFMFNFKYSYALAHFHVASKKNGNLTSKEDLEHADRSLKKAMIAYPWTVTEILGASKQLSDEYLRKHALFDSSSSSTRKDLKDLTSIYVAFASHLWNEQPVREWLHRNGKELADQYDNDVKLKLEVENMKHVRSLFRVPREVNRHLSVIKYMGERLIEREIPWIVPSHSFDPFPPYVDGTNPYDYTTFLNIADLLCSFSEGLAYFYSH